MIRKIAKKLIPHGTRRHSWTKRIIESVLVKSTATVANPNYQDWILNVEPTTITQSIEHKHQPLISLLVPAFNTPDRYLDPLLDSVLKQSYDNWELVLVQGGSTDTDRAKAIRTATSRDPRIKLVESEANLGIAGNTNLGIKACKGEFIAFLDHDDTLAPFALNEVVSILQSKPDTDLFYSDEDKLSDDGTERSLPFFKPGWSPDLFLHVNYLTHFCVVRADLARQIGGIREGFDGSQDFDFLLHVIEKTSRIVHIPKILYHWRLAIGSTAVAPSIKGGAHAAGVQALTDYLNRNQIRAEVIDDTKNPTNYHIKYLTPDTPLVSIIIPFMDKIELLQTLIPSILNKTTYHNYEVILVSNNSTEPKTKNYLNSLSPESRIRIFHWDHPFNWSAVNNYGRKQAKGEVLLFLNNDMKVQNGDWLEELVGVAIQPKVGTVGALLFYPDNTIQHAGVVLGMMKMAGHVFRRLLPGNFTYFGLADWPRNYLAVTGACMAVKATLFDKLNGFDEKFIMAGSDVAFGIACHEAGYLNVFWPFAKLTHYESISVGSYQNAPITDVDNSLRYYKRYHDQGDPYFNPNLDLNNEQIALKGPNS